MSSPSLFDQPTPASQHGRTWTPIEILAQGRHLTLAKRAADLETLDVALLWADAHPVVEPWQKAFQPDTGLPLTGPGTPAVNRDSAGELAVALGLTDRGALQLMADALQLRHRLPRVWHEVCDGRMPTWKARRVAEASTILSKEAADWVDRQVAPFADGLGTHSLDRLINVAVDKFMPEQATEREAAKAEPRYVRIDHDTTGIRDGYAHLEGVIDPDVARELDTMLDREARRLAADGDTHTHQALRARALGELTHQAALPGTDTETADASAATDTGTEADTDPAAAAPRRTPKPARHVIMYFYLSDLAVHGLPGTPTHGTLGHGRIPVTVDAIRDWCGTAGQIVIKPVIDLTIPISVDGYDIPERIHDHVTLTNRYCIYPRCPAPAHPAGTGAPRNVDVDHTIAYNAGGATSTDNLAPLCRKHHRWKTHHGYRYVRLADATYLWSTPTGQLLLSDRSGAKDVTPPGWILKHQPPDLVPAEPDEPPDDEPPPPEDPDTG